MSQANFPLFPLTQQHTMISYGDVLNTPATSRDCVPLGLHCHWTILYCLRPSISLFTDSSMTTSFESPQMYTYTQLVCQYQQSQDDLKKVNQEYGQLKYMRIIY